MVGPPPEEKASGSGPFLFSVIEYVISQNAETGAA
jgi:hypothetical protein